MEEIKDALKRQRFQYVDELANNDPPSSDKYQGGFATLLQHDIEKDIEVSSNTINELQKAVEVAKSKGGSHPSPRRARVIEERRQERDAGFAAHQKLLHARENLRELMKEGSERRRSFTESMFDKLSFRAKKGRDHVESLHSIYLEMYKQIKSIKADATKLVEKKVKMISVKEAIRNTMVEIQENSESQGVDTDCRGGTRATHVLRQSRIPREWLTLTEQVAVILADPNSAIAKMHNDFTEAVINRCSAAVFEKRLLNLSERDTNAVAQANGEKEQVPNDQNGALTATLPHNTKTDDSPRNAESTEGEIGVPRNVVSLEGEIGFDDVVIIHNTTEDHLKRLADALKLEIHAHFEKIVKEFQDELSTSSKTVSKKIWLCYEAHFYDIVMTDLVKVYEFSYSQVSNKLSQCIPELGAEDLNLEDTIVVRLLDNGSKKPQLRVQFSEETQHVSENTDEVDRGVNEPEAEAEQKMDVTDSVTEKEALLRHLSTPEPAVAPDANHQVKKVKIHYPSSVTMIYNRRTCPLPCVQSVTGEFECGMEALMFHNDDDEVTEDIDLEEMTQQPRTNAEATSSGEAGHFPQASPARKMKIKRKYYNLFLPALNSIHDAIRDPIPLVKLQHLTRCLREIAASIGRLQEEEDLKPVGVCVDNLLDMLVILLCNCSAETVARLHAHVMMLTDLMPPCLMNGPYEYSILQFFGAFQVVQERVVVKSRNQ